MEFSKYIEFEAKKTIVKKRKRSMRVLLVIDSLGSGGAQRQIVWLAIGLSRLGHTVSLFSYNPHLDHFRPELEAHGVEIHDCRKRYRFDLAPVLSLRKIMLSRSIDAVVSFLDTPNFYSILAAAGNKKTKVIVSERYTFPGGRVNLRTWSTYQCFRAAEAITVNSIHQRDNILRRFPWSTRKLFAIWNGVDLETFRPGESKALADSQEIDILGVGTIVAKKNVLNLIRALHLSRERGARLTICWYGKTTLDDDSKSERSRCDCLIRELGLQQYWRWCGVSDKMHEVYPQYGALIHPSFSEGLPNAICEALSCGLPVLASRVGDHSRLVSSGVNGWLFDPASPEEIADTLVKFCSSSIKREQMSIQSRRVAEEELGVGRFVDDYESVLYEICQVDS